MTNITDPPVDVDHIAEFLGFDVLPFNFPDQISAVTFIENEVRSIGVNLNHARTRQRFSVAHELGHFLLRHESYDHDKTHVESSSEFASLANPQEREADEFAAELLMPREFLRRDVASYGLNVSLLAKRYQVSEQAMWIQLLDWKLASHKTPARD